MSDCRRGYVPTVILKTMDNVITQDSIILNECVSWINLATEIIHNHIPEVKLVELR